MQPVLVSLSGSFFSSCSGPDRASRNGLGAPGVGHVRGRNPTTTRPHPREPFDLSNPCARGLSPPATPERRPADRRDQAWTGFARITVQAFVPPKPKEFLISTRPFVSRPRFAT